MDHADRRLPICARCFRRPTAAASCRLGYAAALSLFRESLRIVHRPFHQLDRPAEMVRGLLQPAQADTVAPPKGTRPQRFLLKSGVSVHIYSNSQSITPFS